MRSLLGKQERYRLWRPLDEERAEEERCHLSASTVHRWLDKAGAKAELQVALAEDAFHGRALSVYLLVGITFTVKLIADTCTGCSGHD